jgi:hypothetical protein
MPVMPSIMMAAPGRRSRPGSRLATGVSRASKYTLPGLGMRRWVAIAAPGRRLRSNGTEEARSAQQQSRGRYGGWIVYHEKLFKAAAASGGRGKSYLAR